MSVNSDWNLLFDKYNVLNVIQQKGFFLISSSQIKEIHEPRLMTKFDTRTSLPLVFSKNYLSILPTFRGGYIIGQFDAYADVEYHNINSIHLTLPRNLGSIDTTNLYSESVSLHCAYISGMISMVAGEQVTQTISGRMGSGTFEYLIHDRHGSDHKITSENSQLEIDGGYEGNSKLVLIEAKNFTVPDFLIRQLYFPYRLWTAKSRLPVLPVFMTFSNDIFSFFEYRFRDIFHYNSIELVKQHNFIIASEKITLGDISNVMKTTQIIAEPTVPFPQADKMERVIDLCGILMDKKSLSADEITENYAFTSRQTAYYTTAAIYLGLVERLRNGQYSSFSLTHIGVRVMHQPRRQKHLAFIELILQHDVFHQVLQKYMHSGSYFDKTDVVRIMHESNIYNVDSESTYERRASTVISWLEWILSCQE